MGGGERGEGGAELGRSFGEKREEEIVLGEERVGHSFENTGRDWAMSQGDESGQWAARQGGRRMRQGRGGEWDFRGPPHRGTKVIPGTAEGRFSGVRVRVIW
jgi:hypothetical protein